MAGLTEDHWEHLLTSIKDGECTPVLGSGASWPALPLASEVAEQWSREYGYPLPDTSNLARVAQYLAIKHYQDFPKKLLLRRFEASGEPDFDDPGSAHGVLSRLPLSVYITTNYDDYLSRALRSRQREPQVDYYHWNGMPGITGRTSPLRSKKFSTSAARPLVYHLHGSIDDRSSMVLTEEDYLTFLLRVVEEKKLLHTAVRTALATNSILFVGYSLSDWTFRILFRGLVKAIGAEPGQPAVSIQLPPGDVRPDCEMEARDYLEKLLGRLHRIDIRLYWGDTRSFSAELLTRWKDWQGDGR